MQLAPLPAGEIAFGVLGDTPYSQAEVEKLDALIDRMNAQALAFVVHVGDIGTSAATQACSNAWLEARQRQFARLRHPVILLPGDNEWSDCARHGLDPGARLQKWRQLFCAAAPGLALERQPGAACENARWQSGGMMFVALNFPGGAEPALGGPRMDAVLEWLDESLALAEQRGAAPIFILMHADPRFERVGTGDAYARLRGVLATHAARFAGRLILVHGDTHVYRDDRPLPGLRRLEVWGSPFVSWLRATMAQGALRVEAGW